MFMINKIKQLLFVDKYYKMSDEELEKEAAKYNIGGYFNGNKIDRDLIIQQRLRVDSENLVRLSVIFSVLAIIISIMGLLHGLSANKLSKQANELVASGNNLQADSLYFARDLRSQEYVENVFNNLYQESSNLEVIQAIRANEPVVNKTKLLDTIDYLESTGSSFCQGTVWRWHLNTTLKNTLEGVCENQQVYDEFGSKKNGLAMLCYEFFPKSKFASTLQTYNLNTCIFHDSSELTKLISN